MMRKLAATLLIIIGCLANLPFTTNIAKAAAPETKKCVANDACFYSNTTTQCVNGVGVAPVVAGNNKLPDSVPAPYHDIFIAAANAQNSQAALVAAIFFAGEHGSSWPDPGGPWASSPVGAQGPLQFMPTTWSGTGDGSNGYAVDGDGDGKKDVQNLTDAAFGAAKLLSSQGGKPGAPETDLRKAIWAYNHADWYVNNVMEAYNQFIVGGTGATGGTSGSTGSASSCGGNIGISPDGFVFPQKTTKAQLKAAGWNPNCVNKISIMNGSPGNPVRSNDSVCHHDYLAADIFNESGVTVVSPRPGRVIRTKNSNTVNGSGSGASVRIYSDPALGGDGLYYYLTHMRPSGNGAGSGIQVTDGQIVTAGQTLGIVGLRSDAQGADPHTHIDISPNDNGFTRTSAGTEGVLLDPQPVLKAAYEALPEN